MNEYSWPADGHQLADRAVQRWTNTVEQLPAGAVVAGDVIGRQPFGVFIRIHGVAAAVGLAEITSMPHGVELPRVGDVVHGVVIGHAEHNCQVKLRLNF